MLCMGWRVDPTHNGLRNFRDRLLTSVFSYNGSICFWNDSYFHTASLYCVLPNTSPAVQCNRWGLAALMASDAPPAPWLKCTVITLPWQNATWDFKGCSTEENISQVLKEAWEDLQNNPSAVLKLISHCIVSVFQRMVSLLLFRVEINQRCNSGSGLNLAEVNGKTRCCFFLTSVGFARLPRCHFLLVVALYMSQWQLHFAALCLPVPVHLLSQTWPCTGKGGLPLFIF